MTLEKIEKEIALVSDDIAAFDRAMRMIDQMSGVHGVDHEHSIEDCFKYITLVCNTYDIRRDRYFTLKEVREQMHGRYGLKVNEFRRLTDKRDTLKILGEAIASCKR